MNDLGFIHFRDIPLANDDLRRLVELGRVEAAFLIEKDMTVVAAVNLHRAATLIDHIDLSVFNAASFVLRMHFVVVLLKDSVEGALRDTCERSVFLDDEVARSDGHAPMVPRPPQEPRLIEILPGGVGTEGVVEERE